MTFSVIQPNLSLDMWFMSPQRSFMPKKKSYWSVSEIDLSPPPPPQSWRTDRTTDNSVLKKLRCLSVPLHRGVPYSLISLYIGTPEIGPSPPPPPPLKVADNAAADGQVGIWKASLPGDAAELQRGGGGIRCGSSKNNCLLWHVPVLDIYYTRPPPPLPCITLVSTIITTHCLHL